MNRNLKNDWKYDQIIITFTNWRLHELKVLRFCVCCLEVWLAYHCTRVPGLCQAAGVHLWSLCSPNQCRQQCLWCKDAKRLDVHPRSQEVGTECLGSLAALSGIRQVGDPSRNSRSSTCELFALPCACTWSRNFLLDGTHQVFFFCHDQRISPWIAAVRQYHTRQSCRSLGVIWIISHAAHGLDASTLSSALQYDSVAWTQFNLLSQLQTCCCQNFKSERFQIVFRENICTEERPTSGTLRKMCIFAVQHRSQPGAHLGRRKIEAISQLGRARASWNWCPTITKLFSVIWCQSI